jgi:hypothetical protein
VCVSLSVLVSEYMRMFVCGLGFNVFSLVSQHIRMCACAV